MLADVIVHLMIYSLGRIVICRDYFLHVFLPQFFVYLFYLLTGSIHSIPGNGGDICLLLHLCLLFLNLKTLGLVDVTHQDKIDIRLPHNMICNPDTPGLNGQRPQQLQSPNTPGLNSQPPQWQKNLPLQQLQNPYSPGQNSP